VIRSRKLTFAALISLTMSAPAAAEQPGITDTEIKFGNIMPYSGPASALSVTGKAFAAYSTPSTRRVASTGASST